MKTIHQFGDSYGCIIVVHDGREKIKNFIELCCDKLNYNYTNQAKGGISNEMILNKLINSIHKFKKGDIVFINFSFFPRGCWYDDRYKEIKSTNFLYNEMFDIKQFYFTKNEHVIDLVEYYLNHTKDYNVRIFTLMNSILFYIKTLGVDIFYTFIDESDWSDELLNVGTSIKFPGGFAKWLEKNNFHFEEESHYTKGIQPLLSNAILNKTNNFTENADKIIIDIEDIDFNIIMKKPVKSKLF
jgi:hypothetical protein